MRESVYPREPVKKRPLLNIFLPCLVLVILFLFCKRPANTS